MAHPPPTPGQSLDEYVEELKAEIPADDLHAALEILHFEERLIEMGLLHGEVGQTGFTHDGVIALASLFTAGTVAMWESLSAKPQKTFTEVGQYWSNAARQVIDIRLAESTQPEDGQHRG